jgi:Mg-chelatase subunit ChlD
MAILMHRNDLTAPIRRNAVRCAALLGLAAICFGADDVARLKQLVGPESQQADYIVLIDTSQSMSHYWHQVIASVSEFAGSLPDNDHVSIVLFDREATSTRVLPRVINTRTRTELRSELAALASPAGQWTDFGRALTLAVAEIARPEAHQLQFVFMFSDFEHDPPADSEFHTADPATAPWVELGKKARLAASNKTIQSFALLLPLGAGVGRDLAAVRSVLGRVETVPINNEETLRAWFERRREEIERDKLRALVREEMSRGWVFEVHPTFLGSNISLRSKLQRLPLSIKAASANWQGCPAKPASDTFTQVRPGQAVDLFTARPSDPWSWVKWLLSSNAPRVVEVELVGQVQVEPVVEIEPALQIEPRLPLSVPKTVSLAISYGSPLSLKIALLFLLLVLSYVTWRIWLAPTVEVGHMIRRITLSGGMYGEEVRMGDLHGSSLAIGNVSDCSVRTRLESPQFAVRLVSKRPGFPRLSPRRGIYAYRVSGSVYYLGRKYDNRVRKWVMQEIPLPQSESQAVPVGFQTRLLVKGSGEQFDVRFAN